MDHVSFSHPHILARKGKEVIELFGGKNPAPYDNGIAKLKTMTMIINETLRLYPPVLGMTRTASREIRLGDLLLPADIELVILCLVTHNDPEIWGEDAHLFKPDRFAEGITKAAKNKPKILDSRF
ncbi:hypothetical protein GIB67_025985 [Kingdonia uniflora]|uniref:Cytochrome P450 n=1 Tax=Kingdonia uniflora TaxID=39325 RepID=A0A7J7L1F6_9MAGN|nr:hypothetical protein GIB67_025985 [Kingdonia uniflora]